MRLSDYSDALGLAQGGLFQFDAGDRRRAELQGQQVQNQLGAQQVAASQQAVAEHVQQQQDEADFHTAVTGLGEKPTLGGLRQLAVRFPKFGKSINDTVTGMEDSQRRQVIGDTAQIHAALAANRPELAQTILDRHAAADKAAGREADPSDTALLGMINSGDPAQLKAAKGFVFATLAAADPDKVASTLIAAGEKDGGKVLRPGDKWFNEDGTVKAAAPFAPNYEKLGPGETLMETGDGSTGGGGQASGGGGGPTRFSPAASSVASALAESGLPATVVAGFMGNFHVEGGYDGAQGDGGSASGIAQWHSDRAATFQRIIGKAVTAATPAEQAKFVAWEMQNPQAAGMTVAKRDAILAAKTPAQAAALIDKYYERSSGRDRKGRMSAATAFSGDVARGDGQGGSAQSSSGARVIAVGAAKPGWTMLSPADNAANGLDPNIRYQRSPDGQITALAGQSKAQLKALPPKVAAAISTNSASVRNIDAAIALLNPRNMSNAAQHARYAIGPSNHLLPEAMLQTTNPGGVSFRAQIGQIGGIIIKETSGAAVSASEDTRLAKWVPSTTDTPTAALAKLHNLRRELLQKNEGIAQSFGPDQGYRPFGDGSAQRPPAASGFRVLGVRKK